ncbi:MAG: ABC transporter ATP-binding protein [Candidatus Riflebacteria bacterium]|nr:ABC transporter ATP-binding protein [Candidatus Riflebacteria bacterium]
MALLTVALDIKNVTKIYEKPGSSTFGFAKRFVKVVDGVSLAINDSEIYGFLGLNGAGKTTTIKMVLGLIQPTSGAVDIFGKDAREPASRACLGFAPERSSFYDYLTAGEVLETLGGLSGMDQKTIRAKTPELLELVALEGEDRTLVKNFSKGMQQRLGIAQSLLADPALLIFDEPTTGLDPFGRKIFKDLMVRLKGQGKAIFFSSHQLMDVQEICDRVGVIHRGKLVHEGPVAELVREGRTVEKWFIELLGQVDPGAKKPIQLD